MTFKWQQSGRQERLSRHPPGVVSAHLKAGDEPVARIRCRQSGHGVAFALRAAIAVAAAMVTLAGASSVARADHAGGAQHDGTVTISRTFVSHMSVSYGDLDLSSVAGAQILYGRIKRAATALCDPQDERLRPPLRRAHRIASCERAAVDAAVARANIQRLTAIHRYVD